MADPGAGHGAAHDPAAQSPAARAAGDRRAVQQWVDRRLPTDVLHVDIAAAGRISAAVLDAQAAHLLAEAGGGYVAEADAATVIDAGKSALAAMVGLRGTDVAFVDSGATAFSVLLAGWPLPAGARVGTVAGEFGSNAMVLRLLADQRGWTLVELPVDRLGRILDVPGGLHLVTFPQVVSQRGVVQPVQAVLDSGVPLLLDVAQSLGQCPVPAGAAAYVGTSRKWLCGPRGVGMAIVAPEVQVQLRAPANLAAVMYGDVRRFEAPEGHVAGRVGLAVAVAEWSPALLPVIHQRAAQLRDRLGAAGLGVVEPPTEPTGISTLLLPGDEVAAARAALLAAGIVTTAVPTSRAAEMTRPVLRLATAAWLEADDLDRVVETLVRVTH